MAIRFVLRLLRYGAFLQAKRSYGRVSYRAVGFFLVRLYRAHFYLFCLFNQMFLFNSQAFRSGRVRHCGDDPLGARYLKAVKRHVYRIHANPVRCERRIVDRGVSAAYYRVARALFVILSVSRVVSYLYLGVLICKRKFCSAPDWSYFFGRFLTLRCFLCHPCFAIKGVVWNVSGANYSNLFSIPR